MFCDQMILMHQKECTLLSVIGPLSVILTVLELPL